MQIFDYTGADPGRRRPRCRYELQVVLDPALAHKPKRISHSVRSEFLVDDREAKYMVREEAESLRVPRRSRSNCKQVGERELMIENNDSLMMKDAVRVLAGTVRVLDDSVEGEYLTQSLS